jgi:hypothetical protein
MFEYVCVSAHSALKIMLAVIGVAATLGPDILILLPPVVPPKKAVLISANGTAFVPQLMPELAVATT